MKAVCTVLHVLIFCLAVVVETLSKEMSSSNLHISFAADGSKELYSYIEAFSGRETTSELFDSDWLENDVQVDSDFGAGTPMIFTEPCDPSYGLSFGLNTSSLFPGWLGC